MADTIHKFSLPPLPSQHSLLLQEKNEQTLVITLKRSIPIVSVLRPWLLGAFVSFLLGFAALLMYQYESDFAVLSAPFWIISVALLVVFVNQLFERQQLILTNTSAIVYKKRWIASPKLLLQRKDNYDVSLLSDKEAKNKEQRVPVVFFRFEAFSFFEYASIEEKDWVVMVLHDFRQKTS